MASISAQQVETSTTVSYSWTADANNWWSVEVYQNDTYIDEYSTSGTDGRTSGQGSFDPDDYGTFTLKLYTTPGGYVATTSVTTVSPAPPATCDCRLEYYLNNRYQSYDTVTLTSGDNYYFIVGFSLEDWDYDLVLDKITTNYDNNGSFIVYPSTSSFTAPNFDFTIRYYIVDLEISSSAKTDQSISMQIDTPSSISNAYYYNWRCGSSTATGTTPTFNSLQPNTSYTITLTIKDSRSIGIGYTSKVVSTSGGSKVWIRVNGSWKQATPWIYSNNGWHQATAYIYNNGWKQC